MFKHIAALGIGLSTLIAAPLALAAPCDPAQPTPRPTAIRTPAPSRAVNLPRRVDLHQVALRRADANRDGRISYAEARAFSKNQFERADRNDNGILSSRELRNASADVTFISRGQGSLVTRAEFDAAARTQFSRLDTNRDGQLSRRELGQTPPRASSVRAERRWSI